MALCVDAIQSNGSVERYKEDGRGGEGYFRVLDGGRGCCEVRGGGHRV